MKQAYTFLAGLAIIFSSCSSSQKAAQTSDDEYYSSGASKTTASSGTNQPEYYSTAPSDQYIQMKVQDPERWSYFDDYSAYDAYYAPAAASPYFGVGYGMGFGMGYGMYAPMGMGFYDPYMAWNSYYMWNSWYNPYFYNPYYGGAVVAAPYGVYSHLRTFNGGSYTNGYVGTSIGRPYRPATTTSYYNPNRTGVGNTYRPSNAGFSSQPARSFAPSSFGGGGFRSSGRH
jgi:hypothetical protein